MADLDILTSACQQISQPSSVMFLSACQIGFGSFPYLIHDYLKVLLQPFRKGIPLNTQSPLRIPLGEGRWKRVLQGSLRFSSTPAICI